jgi:hypothetical protein
VHLPRFGDILIWMDPRWEQKRTEGYVIVSRLLALQKRLATPLYMFSLIPPPHIYVSKCVYVYVHISLFLPECDYE